MGSATPHKIHGTGFLRRFPFYARYTLRFHLPAEVLLGIFGGTAMLASLVSRKTLGASDLVLALQTSVPMMTFLLAVVWQALLAELAPSRVLLMTGLFGRGVFLCCAFVTGPIGLLLVMVTMALFEGAFIPARNLIFRSNYDDDVRGRAVGGVAACMHFATIATILLVAACLDRWSASYRVIFPIAGALGIGTHLLYARVRGFGHLVVTPRRDGLRQVGAALQRAVRTTVRILREDAAFRRYQIGFFLYGAAFIMILPLVVFLIVDDLKLDYANASWASLVIMQVMLVLLSPLAGRLLDRSHPARVMGLGCSLLSLHAVILIVTDNVWLLFCSYLVHGVAMAPVMLAWNLGPVHMAPTKREAADYMAVHVTLTGVRAILAPAIALLAKEYLGLRSAFAIAAGLYVLAAFVMFRLARRVTPLQ